MTVEKLTPIALVTHEGKTKWINITVKDQDGAVVDLTGASINFTLAKHPGKAPILTKTVGTGITLTDPTAGEMRVVLTSSDLAGLKGAYNWECGIVDAASRESTVAFGSFDVLRSNT